MRVVEQGARLLLCSDAEGRLVLVMHLVNVSFEIVRPKSSSEAQMNEKGGEGA